MEFWTKFLYVNGVFHCYLYEPYMYSNSTNNETLIPGTILTSLDWSSKKHFSFVIFLHIPVVNVKLLFSVCLEIWYSYAPSFIYAHKIKKKTLISRKFLKESCKILKKAFCYQLCLKVYKLKTNDVHFM